MDCFRLVGGLLLFFWLAIITLWCWFCVLCCWCVAFEFVGLVWFGGGVVGCVCAVMLQWFGWLGVALVFVGCVLLCLCGLGYW